MGIMSLSEIMDRSIDVLRKYMKGIVLYSLCYGLIYSTGVVFLVFAGGIAIALSAALMQSPAVAIVLFSITAIILLVIALSSKIGVIKITGQLYSDENIGLGEALGATFKNLHKVLGIVMIELVLFIPVGGIFGIIIYFLAASLDSSTLFMGADTAQEVLLIVITVLTGLALLFAVLIYITMFSFSLQAAVMEKRGVFASVKRSIVLIIKNFWKVFGSTLLFGLTIYAIQSSLSSFLSGILSLLFLLLKLLDIPMDYLTFLNLTLSLTSWPLRILSALIITPVGTIMTTLLYYNQRFKLEGLDMVLRLKDIQKIDERKQSSELV